MIGFETILSKYWDECGKFSAYKLIVIQKNM